MHHNKYTDAMVGQRSLTAHVANIFARHGDFSGRTSREEYWSFVLFYNVVMLIVSASFLALPIQVVAAVFAMISVPLAAVAVRRLHDVGRSGKWLLLVPLSTLSGYLTLAQHSASSPSAIGWAILCLVSGIACYLPIRWLNSPGQMHPNKYGSAPTLEEECRQPLYPMQ